MIGKQDWIEMANQVYELEMQMRTYYTQLASQVSDPELKAIFSKLVEDENRHAKAVDTIADKIAHA